MNKNLITLLALFLVVTNTYSQKIRSTQGIGLNEVSVIELAANGDIWAGSFGQGIAFYNAAQQQWTYFDKNNTPVLRSDTIYDLQVAVFNGLQRTIAGTADGAFFTMAGGWDSLNNLTAKKVWGVTYKPDTIWTVGPAGLVTFDSTSTFRQTYPSPFLPISCIQRRNICSGVWVGTANKGLFYTDNGTNFIYIDTTPANQSLVDMRVNAITLDINCNAKMVGTKGGLSICPNGMPCQNFTTANSNLPQNDVTDVAIDCKGRVWLATRDSGIAVFTPPANFTRITKTDGLPDNRISTLSVNEMTCEVVAGSIDGNVTVIDSSQSVKEVLSGFYGITKNGLTAQIFPQPASHSATVSFGTAYVTGTLQIFDLQGALLQSYEVYNRQSVEFPTATLLSGAYIVSVLTDTGTKYMTRLVVVH